MKNHETYMRRCIQLAGNGSGLTEPNPYVGAVVVYNNQIVGEGYHKHFGGPHAEVFAIDAVADKTILKDCTLYVNLEPCSHHGKTPPCTDLILNTGIKNIVVAMQDPNPLVKGNGIRKLENAGCKVTVGVLEKEARWLNRRFITFQEKARPYVILKWAQTKDGFIDIDRSQENETGKDNWITGPELKTLVHRWRAQEQAILIGYNTMVNDNPQLTVREWTGRNPQRILVTDTLPAEHFNIFGDDQKTIVFNPVQNSITEKAEYIKLEFDKDLLKKILKSLFEKNISSVMVEGGRQILESFISSGLWDEARVLTGNITFGKGLPAPVLKGAHKTERKEYDKDLMQIFIKQTL